MPRVGRTAPVLLPLLLSFAAACGGGDRKAPDRNDSADSGAAPPAPGPDGAALDALERASTVPLQAVRQPDGLLSPLLMEIELPGDPADRPAQLYRFLEDNAALYRISDPRTELVPTAVRTTPGGAEQVTLTQHVGGVPLLHRSLRAFFINGALRATTGAWVPALDTLGLDPDPRIDAAAAIAAVRSRGEQTLRGVPRLFFIDGRTLPALTTPTLAWRVDLAGMGAPTTHWVDARSGAVLGAQAREHTEEDYDIWDADYDTPDQIRFWNTWDWYTYWGGPSSAGDYPDGGDPDGDQPVIKANWAQAEQDYRALFGRPSWQGVDDPDDEIDTFLYVSFPSPNAAANASDGYMFFSRSMTHPENFAHEHTHLWTWHEAQYTYSFENGAIAESLADTFSVLRARIRAAAGAPWDATTSIYGDSDATPGGRHLCTPGQAGTSVQPDHVLAAQSSDGQGFRVLPLSNDEGGVHTNSGIINTAHCRIADGYTQRGFSVQGRGDEATAALLYVTVLNDGYDGGMGFAEYAAQVWLTAALGPELWAPTDSSFTAADACHVGNAFASVGVQPGLADADCDGDLDAKDSDDDGDFVDDTVDNCVGTKNPAQQDLDADGQGDSCDGDDDADGRADAADNCPLLSNPAQTDNNADGTGDDCEDDDADGVFAIKDNCPALKNPSQGDQDGDGVGDGCDDDLDGDGLTGEVDSCLWEVDPSNADADGDGWGDLCDDCPAAADPDQEDCDNNGVGDACQSFPVDCPPDDPLAWTRGFELELPEGGALRLPALCPMCAPMTRQDWAVSTPVTLHVEGVAGRTVTVVDRMGRRLASEQVRADADGVIDLVLDGGTGWAARAPGAADYTELNGLSLWIEGGTLDEGATTDLLLSYR